MEQWQLTAAKIMERNLNMDALTKDRYLKRDFKWVIKYKIDSDEANFNRAHEYIEKNAYHPAAPLSAVIF